MNHKLHHLSLQPLLPGADEQDLRRVFQQVSSSGEQDLLAFLLSQGLASFWHKKLVEYRYEEVSPAFMDALHQSRLRVTGLYMTQRHGMQQLKACLDTAGVEHLVFKGGHIRERIYDEPALRPAADLDVLVSRSKRKQAIEVLVAAGYGFYPVAENISHEATLSNGRVSIDLHWDLLRPGRTRVPLADDFLQTRQDYGSHWGANVEATLFLMLVHPVFTKYTTTPQASLMRILDLYWWLARNPVDWGRVLSWLERAGLCTAAWITLEWAGRFGKLVLPDEFVGRIAPGPVRRAYLRYWLDHDLAGRLLDRPLLIQAAFTLPAHDRVSDAWRAVSRLREVKRHAEQEVEQLTPGK